ncbi:LacI family DNA-binding transcriptional regulator [Flavivirga sp. 57AJ16]|uniref:LacI family DNA-binding transcriptional regulator n=1 Tax=Flavivirga sp. 57AJ16 TaxID=3025307 RepID=UPI002365320F|nr:LacI family DNA-binding transcriptional regulator [Flavivirga sp. 57AJ16]MDD7888092.1 LacI family DNA-binding transcriptional regulator [Flavivirga sp. 57AJ16]
MKTIKDIAALANVSIGTVDRVIHNRPGVSKKTKERIEEIIQEHNFQINKTARTLALNKKYDIAVLIPAIESSSDFWYLPKKGIEKASKENEIYKTSVSYFHFNLFDSNSFKEAFDKLLENSFDAVLLAPVFLIETQKRLIELEQRKIPYVFINIELQGASNISYIGQHSFDSGALAAKLMSLLVHREEEVIIVKVRKDNIHHSAIEDRISGFKSYFNTKALPIKIHEVILPNTKDQIAIDTFIYKTLSNQRIKGLFVPSSKVSIMAKYIEKHKLKHLKLIGYDLNEENAVFIKNETIDFLIDQNAFFQGYEGTKTLFNFIINDIVPEKNKYLPIKLLTKENIKYL